MPSNIAQLIQTIVGLREVQIRDRAQKLAEQMAPGQIAANAAAILQGRQALLRNMSNPDQMLPYTDQFASGTGVGSDAMRALISGTAPSTEAVRGEAMGQGNSGGQFNTQAAATGLTGQTVGDLEKDALFKTIFGSAQQHLNSMPEQERQGFIHGVLQRAGTGQTLTQAAIDQQVTRLSPEERTHALRIGQGLAPSASEEAQIRLGWANNRLGERQLESQSAIAQINAMAQMAEAQAKLTGSKRDAVTQLLTKRDELQQTMFRSSATLTPEGRVTMNKQINAYNEMLRRQAPEVFGPQGTMPLIDLENDATIGTTGVGAAVLQSLKQKR